MPTITIAGSKEKAYRLHCYVGMFIFKIVLDLIYVNWIVPNYEYTGFNLSVSILCYTISWLAIIVFSYFVIRLFKRGRTTDLIIGFIILLYYFPTCTLFAFQKNDISYFIFATSYFILLILWNSSITIPSFVNSLKERGTGCNIILVVLGLMMVGISGIYTGFRITFNLSEFYELRAEAAMNSLPTIVSFAYYWGMNLIPIGLAYSIAEKKKTLGIFCLITMILGFSYNGKKSVLFFMFLVTFIGFFYKDKYQDKIPALFGVVGVLTYVERLLNGAEAFISKYFIRRLMFIPPYFGEIYFDFFHMHEYDYLRQSILRRFGFQTPYTVGIAKTIGNYLYGDNTNANTGLCGDAFANFGWLSLLIYPLLLIIVFKILENCSEGIDRRIQMCVAFSVAYTFISGSFFMNLLTNGYIVLCVLVAFMPRRRETQLNS